MNAESQTMLNELLSYLYGSFLITYVLCIIGAIIKEILYSNDSKRAIPIKRIIFGTIPATALLCFIQDKLSIGIYLYVILCIIGGSGSGFIADIIFSDKFLPKLLKSTSKAVSDPAIKILSDIVDEAKNEEEKEDKKEEADDKKEVDVEKDK